MHLAETSLMRYRDANHRNDLGAVSIRKTVLPGMTQTQTQTQTPNGRLIFNMEITIRR